MLPKTLTDQILTIGPAAKPQGGIAQVIINYMIDVYSTMPRIEFNAGHKGAILKNILAFIASLFKEFRLLAFNRKIKIVHFHTAAGITFIRVSIGWGLAKLFRKKTIIHIHAGSFADYYSRHPRYVRFVLSHSDCVIALSDEWKQFFTKVVGLEHVTIVNNVIPFPERVDVAKDNRLHLLFLGHMIANKGIFDLLDVMLEHHQELQDKVLLHVCGSRNEEEVKTFISANHLDDIVKFEGWVTGQQKVALLNLCDIYILPSYIEGLPLSILECMSYGMPIISTRIGGIPSIVRDGSNGFLISPGDKHALYDSIKNYLDDSTLLERHGSGSLDHISAYLPPVVSLQLEALYRPLLSSTN